MFTAIPPGPPAHTLPLSDDVLAQRLREVHLRPSAQRVGVLAAVLTLDADAEITCPGLYQLIAQTRGSYVPISACYRILGLLERVGMVRHRYRYVHGRPISVFSRARSTEPTTHLHFVCTRCLHKTPLFDGALWSEISRLAQKSGMALAAGASIDALCQACAPNA